MSIAKLTSVDYWEDAWKEIKLPQVYEPKRIPEIDSIFRRYLPRSKTIIEIGCAPGRWMAYFFQQFDCEVYGIEYAPDAAEITVKNLNYLQIPPNVIVQDFFNFETSDYYDVVFSAGFVEHFEQPERVLERIIKLAAPDEGIVVTIIPSMIGINRWISKTFRPEVAAKHFPISLQKLIKIHEKFGLRTEYCDYFGCLNILLPMEKNSFAKKHKSLSNFVNFPFRLWNKSSGLLMQLLKTYPKVRHFSSSIVYIGKRA